MGRSGRFRALAMVGSVILLLSPVAGAYTANKVWFEFRDNGRYRVTVNYTVPGLKEYRASWVDFPSKKEAETFYWKLVRGADFHPPDPKKVHFRKVPTAPRPW